MHIEQLTALFLPPTQPAAGSTRGAGGRCDNLSWAEEQSTAIAAFGKSQSYARSRIRGPFPNRWHWLRQKVVRYPMCELLRAVACYRCRMPDRKTGFRYSQIRAAVGGIGDRFLSMARFLHWSQFRTNRSGFEDSFRLASYDRRGIYGKFASRKKQVSSNSDLRARCKLHIPDFFSCISARNDVLVFRNKLAVTNHLSPDLVRWRRAVSWFCCHRPVS